MIGTRVTWRHITQEGAPTRDVVGSVRHVSTDGARFRLLVEHEVTHELWSVGHDDVMVLTVDDTFKEIAGLKETGVALLGQLSDVATAINSLGLLSAIDGMTTSAGVIFLLQTLAEQSALDDARISALISERDEALARAREAEKPKEKKRRPIDKETAALEEISDEKNEAAQKSRDVP